jgi:TetR/AcrR family transcriptional regulator
MKTSKRKRLSGDERRQRLIETAIELFANNGFEGTTTRQIAKAAGVNEALIFRDFENKQGLYAAILDYKMRESGADEWLDDLRALAEKNDDEGFVRSLTSKILESYRDDPQYQRLMFYSSLEGHELSKMFHETRGLPIFRFLCDYVARRQADGAFRKIDPGIAVLALVGTPTYFAIVKRLFGNDTLNIGDEDAVEIFTALTLGGLRSEPKQTTPGPRVQRHKIHQNGAVAEKAPTAQPAHTGVAKARARGMKESKNG